MKNKSKKAMSDDLKMMCEYLPKSMKFKTKSERLVCAVMMFYANRNKSKGFEFSIPIAEIAKITCIGKTTVSNAVNKLVDDGVFNIVCKGNSVSKKATLYRLNGTVKPNSRVVDSQGFTDNIELFGETDGLEQKVVANYNYNNNYKKNDNKRYDSKTINDNKEKRSDTINVNNESFERLLNVLDRLVVSVETMNSNIVELKTILSQQGRSLDCLISRVENINNRTAYSDNKTISTPEKVYDIDSARSPVSQIEDKNSSTYATTSSTTTETDGTVTPRSSFDIISSSPVATGIDIQQQPPFISSTGVDIDDINDAKASLHSSRGSSTQDRITSLWVEIERGSDFESAYSELQGMFNAKVVTPRQWELTQRKYEKRKSSRSLDQNQKKKKEKKVETQNHTLSYFPEEQRLLFNDVVLKNYNACKTALDQEKNEGKAFDDEQYIKAFNIYAQNFDELSKDTDQYGNKYGDYDYLKRKVYMNPFVNRCDATTREICERYQSIQAKIQEVANV